MLILSDKYLHTRRTGGMAQSAGFMEKTYSLGIDIGSTTVKIALLDSSNTIVFSDYQRHYANIQETLASLIKKAL